MTVATDLRTSVRGKQTDPANVPNKTLVFMIELR